MPPVAMYVPETSLGYLEQPAASVIRSPAPTPAVRRNAAKKKRVRRPCVGLAELRLARIGAPRWPASGPGLRWHFVTKRLATPATEWSGVNADSNLTHLPPERRSKSDPPGSVVAMLVRGGRSPGRTSIAALFHLLVAVLLTACPALRLSLSRLLSPVICTMCAWCSSRLSMAAVSV